MRWWPTLGLIVVAACTGGAPPPPAPALATARPPGSAAASSGKEDIDPEGATGMRHGMKAKHGGKWMVGAANPHASEAGASMLRAGGSAVDAAIAMAMVLTLVEPQSSGIGGGAFLLHFDDETNAVAAYDGRETAPASATPDMFLQGGKPRDFYDAVIGGLSVGVPGQLRMLELAHRAHGKLPWKRLFEPAIMLAEKGFAVSPRLHGLLERDRFLAKMKVARAYFLGADGKPKPVGTVIRNPDLAAVLRAVAEGGADAFYRGDVARDVVQAAAKAERNPGRLTERDLVDYRAVKRQAICRPYRKYRVCGMPPPTSGGITTLQILGMLERFDIADNEPGSVADVHLLAEAGKLAYADRDQFIGDPDFVTVPTQQLLAPAYLAKRAKLIDPHRAMGVAAPGVIEAAGAWAPDTSDGRPSTSHLVAVDAEGDAVSMTASIEGAFGSHVMVRGFLLNNELTDFSFVPEKNGKKVQNRVEPKKRPRSSMAPIIVLDDRGELKMVVGSPGGSRIIGYVARVLVAVLDHEQDVQAAIAAPNFLNRNGATELERIEGAESWLAKTKPGLVALGHEVKVGVLNSGVQAILVGEHGYVGGADPRREGVILAE